MGTVSRLLAVTFTVLGVDLTFSECYLATTQLSDSISVAWYPFQMAYLVLFLSFLSSNVHVMWLLAFEFASPLFSFYLLHVVHVINPQQ